VVLQANVVGRISFGRLLTWTGRAASDRGDKSDLPRPLRLVHASEDMNEIGVLHPTSSRSWSGWGRSRGRGGGCCRARGRKGIFGQQPIIDASISILREPHIVAICHNVMPFCSRQGGHWNAVPRVPAIEAYELAVVVGDLPMVIREKRVGMIIG